jgi:radical SAM protein (TIGR01212 family)
LRCEVWVELGLQTANDKTAEVINRGYPRSVFERAAKILEERGIPTVVHLMIGLPGEDDAELCETADFLDGFRPFGIKIHSVYVMQDTRLAEMYERGEYVPLTREEYIDVLAEALTYLPPETVIGRVTGDAPAEDLLAPEWSRKKLTVIDELDKLLYETNRWQGMYFLS